MVKNYFEKLYLSKDSADGTPDIYVNKCPMIQHQLDGIRFLYKALKKNKRGVILNDPSGYGKRVQTVLFLSAVLPTLDKSVLILCREGKEQGWVRHFQEWTQFSDDVAIELSNPFAKKKVIVSALYCAAVFARRDWSLLVVDGDLTKNVLKASLRAALRVWITSSNLKEDLCQFSTFYSWVHPKEKFLAEKYKANNKDIKDVLIKAAMLDAFLENIVLRRESGETPFPNAQVPISNNVMEARITKKNKDSTGTKIKRTKLKSVATDNTLTAEDKLRKVARTTKNTIDKNTDEFEMGNIEVKPTKEIKTRKENTNDFNIGVINANSQEDGFSPLRHKITKKNKFLQWHSDLGSEDGQIHKKINSQVNEGLKNNTSQIDDSESQSKVLRWNSDTDSENGHKDLVLNVHKSNELSYQESSKENNEIDVTSDKIDDAKDNLENSGSVLVNDETPESLHINDTENGINKIYPNIVNDNKLSEDLFSTDFSTKPNEINVKAEEIIYDANKSANDKLNDLKIKKTVQESNQTDLTHAFNEKTENEPENADVSSFELKMKKMEELILKKYKGSFLDSIF